MNKYESIIKAKEQSYAKIIAKKEAIAHLLKVDPWDTTLLILLEQELSDLYTANSVLNH